MKNIKKLILLVSITLFFGSLFQSCNFLNVDRYFMDTFKSDSIFATQRNAEGYLWSTPLLLPDASAIWGNSWGPGELGSDEMVANWRTTEFPGSLFTVGEVNSSRIPISMNIWRSQYLIINKCNEMLANIGKVPNMTTADKAQYISYVHFMRGLAYYYLLQNWGPIMHVGDEVITGEKSVEEYNKERLTYDQSVDTIVREFKLAARAMPTADRLTMMQAQNMRPSKGVALAYIARLRLQQASPLFNGGEVARQYFGTWKRASDGANYVSQVYDEHKWAVAADACKKLMDLNYYELHTVPKYEATPSLPSNVSALPFPQGAGNIDPYHSYKDMFSGETLAQFNKEFIWSIPQSINVKTYIRHSFSRYLGGWGGMSVPQKIVDMYYMKDGKDIDGNNYFNASDSIKYNADLNARVSKTTRFSGYTLLGSFVPAMYENREIRFYANIGFTGAYWALNSVPTSDKSFSAQQVHYDVESLNGKAGAGDNVNDYTCTGYVPVKYIHADDALKDGGTNNASVLDKPFPIIRYAEILLSYVEALNEISGTQEVSEVDEFGTVQNATYSRNENEIMKYFNMIHYRVGLPGLTQVPSQTEMRNLIKKERTIELFNENHRFYDIRRWGDYLEVDESSNFTGLNVEGKRGDKSFFQIVPVNTQNVRDRVTDRKMVWLPIPHVELLKVPKMDQNPGWAR